MKHYYRYTPLVRNIALRTAFGVCLLVVSAILVFKIFNKGRIEIILAIFAIAWIISLIFTDKYVHKYPQRYFSYLFAAHLKAAIVMSFIILLLEMVAGNFSAPQNVLWTGYIIFIFADALVSVARSREIASNPSSVSGSSTHAEAIADNQPTDSGKINIVHCHINIKSILTQIRSKIDRPLLEFIKNKLGDRHEGNENVLVLDDLVSKDCKSESDPVGLIVGRIRINDVLRLNLFLQFCVKRIAMGGYFIGVYMPLENVVKDLKHRYKGLLKWTVIILHFIWFRAIPKIPWLDKLYFSSKTQWLDALYISLAKRRNRVLSKAEVWGRFAYCGMNVIAESSGDGERYIIAQRVDYPMLSKIPSYYPIVSLEKVSLDGNIIYTHKIRTMFPFSEFIQKRMYEDHGLTESGKFRNDFRLTELGKVLRKFWLDELPQIFDWLRGDIKLVGIRATSRHFLSLYPKKFLDLYFQIKPGLIPPIFDESVTGFEQIVAIEYKYLQDYEKQPIRTDIKTLIKTFTDIVFRGVRSR